jgi:hypothetical protein
MAAETPRYRLTTAAFMPPAPGGLTQYLNAGAEVAYEGSPGWHMTPINDTAKDAVKKAFPGGQKDPTRELIQKVASAKFSPDGGAALA